MYLNTTSVQNRKHKYTQGIVIKTGCWSFRSLPSFMVCGVITCCIISTLQELYCFLFVWRFKKVDFFSELYSSFISINVIFLILKSIGIQKTLVCWTDWQMFSVKNKALENYWLFRDHLEVDSFGFNLGHSLAFLLVLASLLSSGFRG